MSKLFISHSSQDDAFVRELRAALADHGIFGPSPPALIDRVPADKLKRCKLQTE